jgi:CRP-like cAMP-binding protein
MGAMSITDESSARARRPADSTAADLAEVRGPGVLARKLSRILPLSEAECATLDLVEGRQETLRSGVDIVREGDSPSDFCALVDGCAYRYKQFPGGRRQIFALLLPGDLCELRSIIAKSADHGVRTLTPATLAKTSGDRMLMAVATQPKIAEALWRAALLDEAMLRAWLLNLGMRKAPARMAHLFCELEYRVREIGLCQEDGSFRLPLTQQDLGDSLGLTSVHVNRVLQFLRAESLIEFHNGVLNIIDMASLRALADFDEAYLRP